MRLSPATEVADTGDVRLAEVRVDSTVRGRPVNSLWNKQTSKNRWHRKKQTRKRKKAEAAKNR